MKAPRPVQCHRLLRRAKKSCGLFLGGGPAEPFGRAKKSRFHTVASGLPGAGSSSPRRYWTGEISMMFILQCGKVMKVAFDKVLLMYSPATYEVSDILSTYTYRRGIVGMDYSYGAAVDLFNNVLCLALVLLSNYFSKRVGEDGIL